ncbi:hypothetical protein [Acinetobacter sp.]|uniref:hypothetical protein n=1 Tax=Acinetobacter sp. TaxID=472 RepID=UPI00388FD6E9
MTKTRKISAKEKAEILENFFFRLHFHRYVSMNDKKILAMLALSDAYVEAHNNRAGEISDEQVQMNIVAALEKMKDLP